MIISRQRNDFNLTLRDLEQVEPIILITIQGLN